MGAVENAMKKLSSGKSPGMGIGHRTIWSKNATQAMFKYMGDLSLA